MWKKILIYKSYFDLVYLKHKSFFHNLNLKIILGVIKIQPKNHKVKIIYTDKIKLIKPFKREHKLIELIIPKYNPDKQYDREGFLKLENLCSNLLYQKSEMNADDFLIVLTDKIIKNKNEINILLNWIDKAQIKKLNKLNYYIRQLLTKINGKIFIMLVIVKD